MKLPANGIDPNATPSRLQQKLWPLGAGHGQSGSSITLGTRIRDRIIKVAADQWRGWRNGQWTPLPGCFRRLANGQSFVFVHINKTGGTSIARALGGNYKTHLTARQAHHRIPERLWNEAFKFAIVRNPWDKVVSHYEFRVLTNQTGLARNSIDFNTWVKLAYGDNDPRYYDNPKMFQPQTEWVSAASGELMVDYVGRFEALADAFAVVNEHLQTNARLKHLNRSPRKEYHEYYSDECAEIIGDWFASDCQQFGYSYENAP